MTGALIALAKVYAVVILILLSLGTAYTLIAWREARRRPAMVVVEWDIVREAEAILEQAAQR